MSTGNGEQYTFTRDDLIEALTRLETTVPVTGPAAGMINAESMADCIIQALLELSEARRVAPG